MFCRERGNKKRNIPVTGGGRSLVSRALAPPALTPQGANEISMFIQMSPPSPLAHSDTTCVNMWLHTSATIAAPEITRLKLNCFLLRSCRGNASDELLIWTQVCLSLSPSFLLSKLRTIIWIFPYQEYAPIEMNSNMNNCDKTPCVTSLNCLCYNST